MSRAARAADGYLVDAGTLIVNVAFVGSREGWVLVDAGMGGYSGSIAGGGRRVVRESRARRNRPDPWPFRSCGSGLDPLLQAMGRPRCSPLARVAIHHRRFIVPATRSAGRWRRHGVVGEALSAGAD